MSHIAHHDYLRQIDHRLVQLDKKLVLIPRLKPVNLLREKNRFFHSAVYEPQFLYKPVPHDLNIIKNTLQAIKIDLWSPIGRLLDEKRHELILKATLLASIGNDDVFLTIAEKLYGSPPHHIIEKASQRLCHILPKHPIIKNPLSAEEASQILSRFLKKQGLFHWKVKIRKRLMARCAIGEKNQIFLKKGELYTQTVLNKLIRHEIETHIYCIENGKLQPYEIFHRGTASYLKTQEGLAYFHQKASSKSPVIGFHSVMWGKVMGFRDLFQHLLKYVSPQKAWKFCVSAKRGMTGTEKPGAFGKNALYYWGSQEIAEFLKNGGKWSDLFLGKFSLHQLPLIKKIKGMVEPKHVPRFPC